MKRKRLYILIAIFILVFSSLACGLFNGGNEATNDVTPTDQPVENLPSEDTGDLSPPEEVDEAESPASPPDVDLGEEYRSEEGGYSFKPIPEYSLEEFFGLASMEAPDADPDLGPFVFMIGGTNEEEKSNEDIYNEFIAEMPEEEISIVNEQTIIVDGIEGLLADITGIQEGEKVAGRIVIIAVTPTQQFTMFASSPQDRWAEVEPLFDAVLASVYFFEPQGLDILEELEEEILDETDSIIEGEIYRQWGVLAEASSEYGTDYWSAQQATGEPDTPECGDFITAWASLSSTGVDWIEISYDVPVIPTEINIYQTQNPDQVVKVEVLDGNNNYHTVYESTPMDRSYDDCPYLLSIPVESDYDGVTKVKISVDQSELGNWNEIDAVELVGYPSDGDTQGESSGIDIPAFGDFPTELSDLPSGGFAYILSSDQGMPVMVTQGKVQDQSTSAEYVIGLISEDQQNTLTLFIPMDVASGILTMNRYDKNASTKGPGSAVYMGLTLFTNTDGIIMVDAISENTITGSVFFTAVDENGNEIAVTGFFNELPLGTP